MELLLSVWGLEDTWAPVPREVRSREPQPRPLNSGPLPGARGSPATSEACPTARVRQRHANTTFPVSSSVRQDFDVPTNHLIGAHNYCTQVGGRGRGRGTAASPSLFSLGPASPLPAAATCLPLPAGAGGTGGGLGQRGRARTVFTTTSLCMFTAGPSGASLGEGTVSTTACLAPPSPGSTKERIRSRAMCHLWPPVPFSEARPCRVATGPGTSGPHGHRRAGRALSPTGPAFSPLVTQLSWVLAHWASPKNIPGHHTGADRGLRFVQGTRGTGVAAARFPEEGLRLLWPPGWSSSLSGCLSSLWGFPLGRQRALQPRGGQLSGSRGCQTPVLSVSLVA